MREDIQQNRMDFLEQALILYTFFLGLFIFQFKSKEEGGLQIKEYVGQLERALTSVQCLVNYPKTELYLFLLAYV